MKSSSTRDLSASSYKYKWNTIEILNSTKKHVQPGCTPAQITWTKWNLQLAHQWKNIQLKCSIHQYNCQSLLILHFLSPTDRSGWFKTIYKGIVLILGVKGLDITLWKYVYFYSYLPFRFITFTLMPNWNWLVLFELVHFGAWSIFLLNGRLVNCSCDLRGA